MRCQLEKIWSTLDQHCGSLIANFEAGGVFYETDPIEAEFDADSEFGLQFEDKVQLKNFTNMFIGNGFQNLT